MKAVAQALARRVLHGRHAQERARGWHCAGVAGAQGRREVCEKQRGCAARGRVVASSGGDGGDGKSGGVEAQHAESGQACAQLVRELVLASAARGRAVRGRVVRGHVVLQGGAREPVEGERVAAR